MKHVFEEPVIEIFELNGKDIVCTSGCLQGMGSGNQIDEVDILQ